MEFGFETAAKVIFGRGKSSLLPGLAAAFGRKVFLVSHGPSDSHGLRPGLERVVDELLPFVVDSEPTVDTVVRGVEAVRAAGSTVVMAIGGGSALDAAKAISVLARNPGRVLDYLEVVGKGMAPTEPGIPCIACPTTAGTGAEVTRNAVLGVPGRKVKVSLRHSFLLPEVALIDPDLAATAPPLVRAGSGLDAITQVLEAFVSKRRNPLVDGLCREALRTAGRCFLQACGKVEDPGAQEGMAFVALVGGMALTNAGLGAVHGLAGPLGGITKGPHGPICARLVGIVTAGNIRALESQGDPEGLLARFDEAGSLLTGVGLGGRKGLVRWLREASAATGIPPLSGWGLSPDQIPEVVEAALQASSMKGNPVIQSSDHLRGMLEEAL